MSALAVESALGPRLRPGEPRLLAGPGPASGHEALAAHVDRLGRRPQAGAALVEVLRQSGLSGKGGAGFPVWRKWAAVASAGRSPLVIVNGSEGEPLSAKDATLLERRPHLILDGAALAAEAVGAADVYIYLSQGRRARSRGLRAALRERRRARLRDPAFRVVVTEHRYVAGESSAASQRVAGGPAKPRFAPPRPSERGAFGRPTLVQNVETLAHVGLIARHGAAWFREAGTPESPGTSLLTVLGNVRQPGVHEVDLALDVGEVLQVAGGTPSPPGGALLGGYFGTWLGREGLLDAPLADIGCGVLAVLPAQGCGILECARIMSFLARETAGQCGPCVNGLPALAATMARVSASKAAPADIDRLHRWARMIEGRGACGHPDGAVRQLTSALAAFDEHLGEHLAGIRCPAEGGFPRPPAARWWPWTS